MSGVATLKAWALPARAVTAATATAAPRNNLLVVIVGSPFASSSGPSVHSPEGMGARGCSRRANRDRRIRRGFAASGAASRAYAVKRWARAGAAADNPGRRCPRTALAPPRREPDPIDDEGEKEGGAPLPDAEPEGGCPTPTPENGFDDPSLDAPFRL
jgi:hypothetical protein